MEKNKRHKAPTLEQRVAATILEKETAAVRIGFRLYRVPPPTIGTLIEASAIISELPRAPKAEKDDDVPNIALAIAKDYRKLSLLAAVLMLGGKSARPRKWLGVFPRKSRAEKLADKLLHLMRPSVMWDVCLSRLSRMELGHFFAITTSLSEASLLARTREAEAQK